MNELKAPSMQSLLESDRGSTDSLLAESLQLDVEDLDDVEYSIPPTGALPTLESILTEFDGDSDIVSELSVPAPTPTPSIAEDGGVRGGGAGGGGSIMRYAMLQGVSAQVSSAADRVNAGLATACAVSSLIAVGTSHGHILNFDIGQTLRWAHQDKHSQGAVSSLAYNSDCTRLLAGYARGLVVMIDTHSGDVLRNLFDAITPNTGVLHVKWTSRQALALCADSGGSVWSLSFTRKLGIRSYSSRCLFSGARGEVCAVEPLIIYSKNVHELNQFCIVALATLSKYFIVTIRPRLKVIKYHTLQGPADCLPLLAWQMVLIQAADTSRSVDPVIVVGRGNQLFFHQLFFSNGRITLLYLRHVQIQANLLSVHWLGPKCVGCLDTSEILHLIDVRSSKELECIDMANAGMVYGSAQFKGLATGGNVSPALALAGTHACYNSIATRGTQLYILGARSLHMLGVRTWTERISYLVKNQRWQEACDLALEGYRAAANRPKRRTQARERIIMLFKEYIAASARAPDYCLGSIVKCLITIGELDLLWTQLWDRLQNTGLFLQHITEHIENELIQRVNPIISQSLVDYWLQISPKRLEEIIPKLDWTCLDLNQVLKAAKRCKLYRTQIYLNTHALNDYTVSLVELIPLIDTENLDLGNCLLVYISSCLAGRGYPSGEIPVEIVHQVKEDILRCLTSRYIYSNATRINDEEEMPYPYLRALLKFDTRETLNVISLAFQEKDFSSELGFAHRKKIINILLEIMTPENATWAEIGCLLNFIAQQISLQCLPRDTQLLEKVLNYLAKDVIANESTRQHSERESAWHELLVNNCLEHISNDEEQLLLAKQARCYYVEEYLLEKLHRYDSILECYLNNSLRHETMFRYIERHAKDPERKIYEQVRGNFKKLLDINAQQTTRIIVAFYKEHLSELLDLVRDDESMSYVFLNNLYKTRTQLTNEQCEQLLELICRYAPDEIMNFLRETDTYRFEKVLPIVEKYALSAAIIYLYEKQSNYRRAFELSLEQLAAAKPNEAETRAMDVSELCTRASAVLGLTEREKLWFTLLKNVLPREDLKSITKSMLHAASQYVDLTHLVQLIMNTRNVSGSFGDIKDLLMSMLLNSRYETQTMETTVKLQGMDLHKQFAKRKQEASRGLWVTMMHCIVCNQRLYSQTNVLVLGPCSHAMHESCAQDCDEQIRKMARDSQYDDCIDDSDLERTFKCPYCQTEFEENCLRHPTELAIPRQKSLAISNINGSREESALGELRLKAPPKKI